MSVSFGDYGSSLADYLSNLRVFELWIPAYCDTSQHHLYHVSSIHYLFLSILLLGTPTFRSADTSITTNDLSVLFCRSSSWRVRVLAWDCARNGSSLGLEPSQCRPIFKVNHVKNYSDIFLINGSRNPLCSCVHSVCHWDACPVQCLPFVLDNENRIHLPLRPRHR